MGLVGLLVAKVLRLPVTASYHTEVPALIRPLGGNAMMEQRGAPLPGLVLRRTSIACSRSRRLARRADRHGRRRAAKLSVHAGRDRSRGLLAGPLRRPRCSRSSNLDVGDRPVILSVGRLSEEKNIPVIIEAVERLQARSPRPLLVIAGDGPERADARAHAIATRSSFASSACSGATR